MIFPRKYTDKEIESILSKIIIDIDSREKVNMHITDIFDKSSIKYEVSKLNFSDYTFHISNIPELDIEEISFANHISIERKNSLDELVGNFQGKERVRFEKEFKRHQGHMILMIECDSYADIFEHNYRSEFTPQSLIGSLHSWSTKYKVPFIFIPKEYAARYIYFTFYYYIRHILKGGGSF